MKSESYRLTKVKLSDHALDIFSSYKTLFDFALTRDAGTFEAEFLKYFKLK